MSIFQRKEEEAEAPLPSLLRLCSSLSAPRPPPTQSNLPVLARAQGHGEAGKLTFQLCSREGGGGALEGSLEALP